MKNILIIIALVYSSFANAFDREDTIKQLMEDQGLLQTFEQQIAMGKKQNEEQGKAIINQMLSNLNPTPELNARLEDAFQKFLAEVSTSWGAEEIVSVWAGYYGRNFTDRELKQLLKHYRSPLAQKEVVASRAALVEFSNHFAEAGKPIVEKAVENFISDLKVIIKECNCSR